MRPARDALLLEGADALVGVAHVAQVVEHLARGEAVRIAEVARASLRVEGAFAEREHRRRLLQQLLTQLLRLRTAVQAECTNPLQCRSIDAIRHSATWDMRLSSRAHLLLELRVGHHATNESVQVGLCR